jgi:hypothetical protein
MPDIIGAALAQGAMGAPLIMGAPDIIGALLIIGVVLAIGAELIIGSALGHGIPAAIDATGAIDVAGDASWARAMPAPPRMSAAASTTLAVRKRFTAVPRCSDRTAWVPVTPWPAPRYNARHVRMAP